jgi:hypothetical protein
MKAEENARVSRRYVALDIHKHYSVVAGVNREGQVLLPAVRVEHEELEGWLKRNLQASDQVVIESITNAWHVYDLLEPQSEKTGRGRRRLPVYGKSGGQRTKNGSKCVPRRTVFSFWGQFSDCTPQPLTLLFIGGLMLDDHVCPGKIKGRCAGLPRQITNRSFFRTQASPVNRPPPL